MDEVLAKCIKAQGGKEALGKIKARVMKGTIEFNGASSPVEILAMAPNKGLSKTDLEGVGLILDGYDGQVAWSKNPWGGLNIKSGDELQKARRDADFYRFLHMKELYPGLVVKESSRVGSNQVWVLEAKPTSTSVERFMVDAKSGLITRQESGFESGGNVVKTTVNLHDFRPVDGIKYPHKIDIVVDNAGQSMELAMKIQEITHPKSIEASRFAKPSE